MPRNPRAADVTLSPGEPSATFDEALPGFRLVTEILQRTVARMEAAGAWPIEPSPPETSPELSSEPPSGMYPQTETHSVKSKP